MEEVDCIDEAHKPILLQIGPAIIVFRLASQEVTNVIQSKRLEGAFGLVTCSRSNPSLEYTVMRWLWFEIYAN